MDTLATNTDDELYKCLASTCSVINNIYTCVMVNSVEPQ